MDAPLVYPANKTVNIIIIVKGFHTIEYKRPVDDFKLKSDSDFLNCDLWYLVIFVFSRIHNGIIGSTAVRIELHIRGEFNTWSSITICYCFIVYKFIQMFKGKKNKVGFNTSFTSIFQAYKNRVKKHLQTKRLLVLGPLPVVTSHIIVFTCQFDTHTHAF